MSDFENYEEEFMVAAHESLQNFLPDRIVERGLQDPADWKVTDLEKGVVALIAEGEGDFLGYVGRENEAGRFNFSVVAWLKVPEKSGAEKLTLRLEKAEFEIAAQIRSWLKESHPTPLDAIYLKQVVFSRGLSAPYGWVALKLEASYV